MQIPLNASRPMLHHRTLLMQLSQNIVQETAIAYPPTAVTLLQVEQPISFHDSIF